jgi:hypothetical protein
MVTMHVRSLNPRCFSYAPPWTCVMAQRPRAGLHRKVVVL